MADYNGWTNRATWNASLWLTGDDEATYLATMARVRGCTDKRKLPGLLRQWCRELWGTRTPDGDSLKAVHWKELAVSLLD